MRIIDFQKLFLDDLELFVVKSTKKPVDTYITVFSMKPKFLPKSREEATKIRKKVEAPPPPFLHIFFSGHT